MSVLAKFLLAVPLGANFECLILNFEWGWGLYFGMSVVQVANLDQWLQTWTGGVIAVGLGVVGASLRPNAFGLRLAPSCGAVTAACVCQGLGDPEFAVSRRVGITCSV
jgi:hypothetical protein